MQQWLTDDMRMMVEMHSIPDMYALAKAGQQMDREKVRADRRNKLLELLMESDCGAQWYEDYAELENEETPKGGIVKADWNDETANRIGKLLEKLDCEIEWCGEWTDCSNCYKAVRTQPTHYGWLPRYSWIGECDIVCEHCIMVDVEGSGYIEELLNNCRKADTLDIDWSQFGFEPPDCEKYETGFHPGQDADPYDVAKQLETDLGQEVDFLFQITGCGQFDVDWIVWVRPQLER